MLLFLLSINPQQLHGVGNDVAIRVGIADFHDGFTSFESELANRRKRSVGRSFALVEENDGFSPWHA